MELTLTHQTETRISVSCNGQVSHTFELGPLLLVDEAGPPIDSIAYGQALYQALFPPETRARIALDAGPERILLVASDSDLEAIAWEYIYGPEGFLVLDCPFLRGVPIEQRVPPSPLNEELHIIAVPSNPLSTDLASLDIDGEWLRLREIIQAVPSALVLERARPASVEQVRRLIANKRNYVMHFMGHGAQSETGAVLCFEEDNGSLDEVTAKQFTIRVRGTVLLVTLNACVSATPGKTRFSNLAAALVRQKVPYALGMRFSIRDDDARTFSNAFYGNLANGTSVEESLLQARWSLDNKKRQWVIGVPVLYTSLTTSAAGFTVAAGTPIIKEHQPRMEVTALPRAEGIFQGRNDELCTIGEKLTSGDRPRILTLHAGGGQGKTALAREAVERFAYAWPDGVWATSLENLPSRAIFAADLARFLGIAAQEILDPNEVERQILAQLALHRVLIVLDNAETLVAAVEANDERAIQLAQFIQRLPSTSVSLLVTSRVQLGWSGEDSYELGGLSAEDGALLFRECAPARKEAIPLSLAEELSRKLDGHPLSLRLLGGAFNASAISLATFIAKYEEQLINAKNKFAGEKHRHYKLYACIETSVQALDSDLRDLLSGLWIFHAPFLPETAVAIFDPESKNTEDAPSPINDRLHTLWQRGLLTAQTLTTRDDTFQFYYLLPTTRPYVEHMQQTYERETLLKRFSDQYASITELLDERLDSNPAAIIIAQQMREDLERGAEYTTSSEQALYLVRWAWILQRLGAPQRCLIVLERVLETTQGKDQALEGTALNNMAMVYQAIGKSEEALKLYQQALPVARIRSDRGLEATIINNMGEVYRSTGQPQAALTLYQQALPLMQETGNRSGEAASLNNMALVYQTLGQPEEALKHCQRALPLYQNIGDRAGEATVLSNMGEVYRQQGLSQDALQHYQQAWSIYQELSHLTGEAAVLNNMGEVYRQQGQPQDALKLLQQALSLNRKISDRAGEATTLQNIALVYQVTGKSEEVLQLCQQALSIHREIGNRAMEATTLNNMGEVYRLTRRFEEALKVYQQALPIAHNIGYRAMEATILSNLGLLYQTSRLTEEALTLYMQALPIHREVGNRAMEATTLNNIALTYMTQGKVEQALTAFKQTVTLAHQIVYPALEATGLANIAVLLYQSQNNKDDAIPQLEQAIALLKKTGLSQDAAGQSIELLQNTLQTMREGKKLS